MQANAGLERARLLMERGRYALAAAELRRALAGDPDDSLLHAYLALCLAENPAQREEALQAALWATAKDPLQPAAWYAVSYVELTRGRGLEAEKAARLAVSLAPESPALLAHLAGILLAQDRPRAALEAAESGLALAPEDVGCLLAAGNALSRLGRHDEAGAALARALARDPEDASAHGKAGWALLRRGDAAGALRHFRESLRLDPTRESERRGMMEALKARNPVYRTVLRAALRVPWMPPHMKWVAIVGGLLLALWASVVAEDLGIPGAAVLPLQAAVVAATLLTWTASPLFDLLLFSDPLGRHALSRAQRVGAVAVGALLAGAAALAVAALTGAGGWAAWAGILLALFTIPTVATLRARPGRPRAVTLGYTLLLLAPAGVFLWMQGRGTGDPATWFGITVGAISLSDLVADALSARRR